MITWDASGCSACGVATLTVTRPIADVGLNRAVIVLWAPIGWDISEPNTFCPEHKKVRRDLVPIGSPDSAHSHSADKVAKDAHYDCHHLETDR